MIKIFSDGGGERNSEAAAACIIENADSRVQLVAYLGAATNNEAEIFGGLLAFSALSILGEFAPKTAIEWHCDSQYVLKSATEYIYNWTRNGWKTAAKKPVKNQALWRAYLELSKQYSITAKHVYGHSGHAENEACDSASTWAQSCAKELIEIQGSGILVEELPAYAQGQWILFDGRSYLQSLRKFEENELDSILVNSFSQEMASILADTEGKTKLSKEDIAKRKLSSIHSKLESIVNELKDIEPSSKMAKTLRTNIEKAIKNLDL